MICIAAVLSVPSPGRVCAPQGHDNVSKRVSAVHLDCSHRCRPVQVAMSSYHSVFLTHDGVARAAGHGIGGRLVLLKCFVLT